MSHLKPISIAVVLFFIFTACSSTNKNPKKPELEFHGLTLSKGIIKRPTTAFPKDRTENFNSQDKEVVALVNFENLSGSNQIRWDWYDPSGNLYLSSGDFPIKASDGKYFRQTTVWHTLVLNGDASVNSPGTWEVKFYVNNEFSDSKVFTIETKNAYASHASDTDVIPKPENWGLIIGIENYAHLPKVQFAKKDALKMREYFLNFLRVPEDQIFTLIDGEATKASIQGYLESYLPPIVTSKSTLYIYFAGHGAPDDKEGKRYLIPYDGNNKFIHKTGYKLEKFRDDIEKLNVRQTYVFLDSCFSGIASRTSEMLNPGTRPMALNPKETVPSSDSIVVLSASSKNQKSNAYPKKKHGLFTYYLLKALKGAADSDDNQWISIKEIYDYVSKQVSRVALRLGTDQNPEISPSLETLIDSNITRAKE